MRRLLRWLLRPLARILIRHLAVDDPWEPVTSRLITPRLFGPGSYRTFRWYFEGESAIKVGSVDDVCRWLSDCQYLSDMHLFNEVDFWQHPRTFENLRKGDCEDHALWAWRKLVELGHRADFFVGQLAAVTDRAALHAWVVFEQGGQSFLMDPVNKDGTPMFKLLPDARADYVPHFSVDPTFKMQSYGGYLRYLKDRERERRRRT